MKNVNWNNIDDLKEYKRPTVGGYAAKIIAVEDAEDKEYLKITWDFADGEFKGNNVDCYLNNNYYPHMATFIRSYKEKALPFFKAFKTSVEESNKNYTFDNNPKSLIGKYVGIVLGEEEYPSNDGTTKTRLYAYQTLSGKRIREGDFKIPALKKLKEEDRPATPTNALPNDFEVVDDDDLPF